MHRNIFFTSCLFVLFIFTGTLELGTSSISRSGQIDRLLGISAEEKPHSVSDPCWFRRTCFILEGWSMGTGTSRNIEHLFIISSWTVLKVIYKHLQFEIVVIVLVCSGQLFSTSVITTADSARMSIQDATETSWPNNLWNVLWRIPCTEFLSYSVLSVAPIQFSGFLGSLYHGVLCNKQCRPSKVVWLSGSRKRNHCSCTAAFPYFTVQWKTA